MTARLLRETLKRRPRRRDRLEGQACPLSARDLAASPQHLGGKRALSRRARFRDDEALVRHGPRPLPGAYAQRLPSAVHRHGDEHEAGARADARDLGGRGSNPSAVPRYDSHPTTRQNRRQPSLLSQTMQSQRKSAPSAKLSIYVCSPRDRERVGSMGRGERDLCAQPMPRMKTGADFFVFFA